MHQWCTTGLGPCISVCCLYKAYSVCLRAPGADGQACTLPTSSAVQSLHYHFVGEARQVEHPMLWVLVLQDCCILQDSLAPLLQKLQVVSRCQVYRILFALPYAVLVVLPAFSAIRHHE